MIRIAVTGPESSGKTTLVNQLQGLMFAAIVPEYARTYLNQIDRPYNENDIQAMAQGQMAVYNDLVRSIPSVIVADTDMLVYQIWVKEKYGTEIPVIEQYAAQEHFDLYFLCRPDLKWEPDRLRENPHDRDRLFRIYEAALKTKQKEYEVIDGKGDARLELAKTVLIKKGYLTVGKTAK